jgi:sortase A
MSPPAGGRLSHPLFRPNPGLCPVGPDRPRLPAEPAIRPPAYLPRRDTRPVPVLQPRANPFTPMPIQLAGRDVKARLLRIGGAVLMLVGAAAVAYVINAVWSSSADADRAQEQLAADFQANQTAAASTTLAADFSGDDPTVGSTAPTITVTTTPGEDIAGPDTRPTVPEIVTEEPPPPGEALGRLLIPAADVDWVMVEGVSQEALAKGPGHMPSTAMPGQPGNAVVSGHRTTHGAPFFSLDLLEPGDDISIETLTGVHMYEVVEVIVVGPTDVWVTDQVDGAWLTLTTCNPLYSSRERLIVFARLVEGPNFDAIAATMTGYETPPQPSGG